jgi:hypothetical protein
MEKLYFYLRWNLDLSPKVINYYDNSEETIDDLTAAQSVLEQFRLVK